MYCRWTEGTIRPPALPWAVLTFAVQVWSIRVDMHFLDDEGNMLDCASIAAMAALRHFRRPDVTVLGEEVTIVRCSLAVLADHTLTSWTLHAALDD